MQTGVWVCRTKWQLTVTHCRKATVQLSYSVKALISGHGNVRFSVKWFITETLVSKNSQENKRQGIVPVTIRRRSLGRWWNSNKIEHADIPSHSKLSHWRHSQHNSTGDKEGSRDVQRITKQTHVMVFCSNGHKCGMSPHLKKGKLHSFACPTCQCMKYELDSRHIVSPAGLLSAQKETRGEISLAIPQRWEDKKEQHSISWQHNQDMCGSHTTLLQELMWNVAFVDHLP